MFTQSDTALQQKAFNGPVWLSPDCRVKEYTYYRNKLHTRGFVVAGFDDCKPAAQATVVLLEFTNRAKPIRIPYLQFVAMIDSGDMQPFTPIPLSADELKQYITDTEKTKV